jgi:hypothetical protein
MLQDAAGQLGRAGIARIPDLVRHQAAGGPDCSAASSYPAVNAGMSCASDACGRVSLLCNEMHAIKQAAVLG